MGEIYMNNEAKVIKKIVFSNVSIKVKSPLRISTGKDDGITDMLILKDKHGQAFIPGTSIVGVLRNYISDIYGKKIENIVFGNAEENSANQSLIRIGDMKLKNVKIIHRDGVAIDNITNVSKDKAKYDYELVDRGAEGLLNIEITVRKKFESIDIDEIAKTIASILDNGINIGALTTKGYGKIQIKKKPTPFYIFDFNNETDAWAWLDYLNGNINKKPVKYENTKINITNEFKMIIGLSLNNAMMIANTNFQEGLIKKGEVKTTSIQLESGNDYVIPGTSIKGAIRNKAINILRTLSNYNEKKVIDFIDNLMGHGKKTDINGNNILLKSRLYVNEVYLKKDNFVSVKQPRTRINSFTGGAFYGNLFGDKPIWQADKSKAMISINIRIKKCTEAEAGLMLLILKDLWLGNLAIGGGKSIGRGVFSGKNCLINYQGNVFKIERLNNQEKIKIDGQNLEEKSNCKIILENYVRMLCDEFCEK